MPRRGQRTILLCPPFGGEPELLGAGEIGDVSQKGDGPRARRERGGGLRPCELAIEGVRERQSGDEKHRGEHGHDRHPKVRREVAGKNLARCSEEGRFGGDTIHGGHSTRLAFTWVSSVTAGHQHVTTRYEFKPPSGSIKCM